MRKWLLPVIAVIGIGVGIFLVYEGNREVKSAEPIAQPTRAPYKSYIAGSGIIESSTKDVAVGTPEPDIVQSVYVKVGDAIKVGNPLFQTDTRVAKAELRWRRAQVDIATSKIVEAQADLEDKRDILALAEKIQDKRAISVEELDRRRYSLMGADAGLATAKAELRASQAELTQAEVELERRTIRSPIDGTVLQVNILPGEFAAAEAVAEPLMMVGSTKAVNIRVDIDEDDAWRFKPGQPAVAVLRGNAEIEIPLEYDYFEPLIVPKKALTGDSGERVDIRVLQVLYSFDPSMYPVYVGQQVDVWIETE